MKDSSWISPLINECRKNWAEGRAVPLTSVPRILRESGIDVNEIRGGRKLIDLINDVQEQTGIIRLLQNDIHPLVWGVIPGDVEVTLPYSHYFTTHGIKSELRFKHNFWKAFAAPLDDSQRRFLFSGNSPQYQDLSVDEEAPRGVIEVEREYTGNSLSPLQREEPEAIYKRIFKWAHKHCINLDEYALRSANIHARQNQQSSSGSKVSTTDLHKFLGLLSTTELHRIYIPADVVSRLLNKRGED